MLFDLRSRGRRRTVQAVYLGLAIVMGGGLVLFGVGTGSGFGGLLDAFKGGGGSGAATQFVSQQEKNDSKKAAQNPSDASAWAALVGDRFSSAGQGSNFNQSTQTFTSTGKKELAGAADAWQRYLKLVPHPDQQVALVAARVYEATNDFSNAASAWEIVAAANPTVAAYYKSLAIDAYLAKQTRKGDLAAAKAISLTPTAQQFVIKQVLQQAKSSTAPGASTATVPGK
jgi:predicted Zn-dependent protease